MHPQPLLNTLLIHIYQFLAHYSFFQFHQVESEISVEPFSNPACFKSGLWLGHSGTFVVRFWSHCFEILAMCFGSLKKQPCSLWTSMRSRSPFSRFSTRMSIQKLKFSQNNHYTKWRLHNRNKNYEFLALLHGDFCLSTIKINAGWHVKERKCNTSSLRYCWNHLQSSFLSLLVVQPIIVKKN